MREFKNVEELIEYERTVSDQGIDDLARGIREFNNVAAIRVFGLHQNPCTADTRGIIIRTDGYIQLFGYSGNNGQLAVWTELVTGERMKNSLLSIGQ